MPRSSVWASKEHLSVWPDQVQVRELSQRVHVLSKAACGFCDSPPLVPGPIPLSPGKAGALESEGSCGKPKKDIGAAVARMVNCALPVLS